MDKYFIGFFPDKTGAVVVLVESGNLDTDFNLLKVHNGTKTIIDFMALVDLLSTNKESKAAIERVSSSNRLVKCRKH